MKNIGLVTEIRDDKVKIRFIKQSACGGNCASCRGCSSKPVEITVLNTLRAKTGDKVEVWSDTRKILSYAFILYILPLIILLTSYLVADLFFTETISATIGVSLFFIFFLVIRIYSKNIKYETKLLRILEDV